MNMQISPQDPEVRAQLQRERLDSGAAGGVAPGNPAAGSLAGGDGQSGMSSRLKPALILLAVAVAVAAFVWFLVQKTTSTGPVAPPSGPPVVSVMVPGTSNVTDRVAALGTISARRDMPVGVAGEGGMVTAIRAEAGQFVGRGQVLAELDSAVQRAQLAQMQAAVAQADADVRLAQNELERAQALVARGFISKADIDRRTATRDGALARVGVARAQVREMQERIARLSIRAPEAGLVLQRSVEPGQVVSSGSGALFRVAAGGQMELRAQVAEQDMAGLAVGQQAVVTPVGSANEYIGTVWLLEPVIDAQSRQGVARIALPTAGELRSGGFANVVIDGIAAQRPRVPQSAIQVDDGVSFVLVVDDKGVVTRRDIRINSVSADGVAVAEGLTGGEQVVVSAGAFLRPGETVTPDRSGSAPAASPPAGSGSAPAAGGD